MTALTKTTKEMKEAIQAKFAWWEDFSTGRRIDKIGQKYVHYTSQWIGEKTNQKMTIQEFYDEYVRPVEMENELYDDMYNYYA